MAPEARNSPLPLPILACMTRAALFTFVGVVWCVRSLQSFADPEYQVPVSASDWFAVLSFSAALFALALALPLLAELLGSQACSGCRSSRPWALPRPVSATSSRMLCKWALPSGSSLWVPR